MKATLEVGDKSRTTCCIACAEHFKATHKTAQVRTVTDFSKGTELDASSAILLYGSDVVGCSESATTTIRTPDSVLHACYDRCKPSVLAFGSRADAEAVRSAHGGRLVTLAELDKIFDSARH